MSSEEFFHPIERGSFLHRRLQFLLDFVVLHSHFLELFLLLFERFLDIVSILPLLDQLFDLCYRVDVVFEVVDYFEKLLLDFVFVDDVNLGDFSLQSGVFWWLGGRGSWFFLDG